MYDKIQPFLKVAFLTACTAAAVSVAVMCIKVASVANNVNNALDYSNPNTPMGRVNGALDYSNPDTPMGRVNGVLDYSNPNTPMGRVNGVLDYSNPDTPMGRVNGVLDYSNPDTPMGRVNTALNSEQKGTFMCNITHAAGKFNALVGSDNLLNEPKNEPKDGNNKPHGTVESVVNEISGAAKGLHNGMKQNGGIGIFSGISYAAEEPTEVSAEGKGTATEAKLAQQQKSSGWFGWLRGN